VKRRWYVWFLALIVMVIIAACSSYNYSTNITNNDSDNEASTEIYFFGIPSDGLEKMKIITYDEFWMKVFNSKGEYPEKKKVFYFGPPSTTKPQSLDYDDNVWRVWKDTNMDYLCVVAYSPDFTDSSRKDVEWKKIVRLKHRNWWGLCSEKLNVNVRDGVLDVED